MDPISGLITHINLQNQSTLPPSPPTPPPSTSKTATQHITTTTLTADIPFSTSINQLHTFSTALSAFLNHYDDLQTHINFINSSIDSKLPPHLVETVSPNLLESSSDQTITASPEVVALERNPKDSDSTNFSHNYGEIDASNKLEVVDVSKNVEEIDVLKKHAETDALKKPVAETFVDQAINDVLEAIVSEQNPKESESDCEPNHESATADFSRNIEEFDASKKLDVVDVSKNCDEIDVLKKHAETDALKKPVAETFVDQAINDVLEAVVSEQNPKESESDCQRNHESATADFSPSFEEFDASKKLEVVVVDVSKNCGEMDASENFVEIDSSKKCEEIDVLKKHVETFGHQSITAVPEAVVLEQKPNGMATSGERSNEINVKTPEGLEETYIGKDPQGIDVLQKPEENNSSMSPEETYTSKKQRKRRKTGKRKKDKDKDKEKALNKFAGKLQFLCKNMITREMRWHVAKHLSATFNLREEIIKALKLAKDPAKLVLNCTGNFFGQETAGRLASVLVLECFVMISNDDGIEIEKSERERALNNAVIWRNRMINEGGFGKTDEVDARGLLLLISGFGIQDDVFKIQDIVDLIRASNVKGISIALRRSAFLMPKIPDVISLMVKNNLEIEAVDIAYTFGLEDTCNSQNILTTYLHNKIKDIQNDSPFQTLEAMKQQLLDLISVKQCLESHKVDPSTLLPDFKINEKIQILEKEVNESKLIQKRKSLENPIHQEAKRACFGHENMRHHHEPVDNYGMVLEQTPSESASDCEWSHESATMPDSTDFSHNYKKIDTLKNLEVVDVSKNSEEIDVSENPVEIDTTKTLEEFDVLKKHEEFDTLMKHAETDTLKKQEEIVTETFGDQTIGVVSGRNPNGMATNGEQSREIVTAPESLEEINVSNKPEEIDVLKKPEELDTSMIPEETVPETSVVSVLQSFCESMSPRQLRQHVATHFSKMINLREEIAKSLKLAKDPVYLVRSSIGSFFVSRSTTFRDYNKKLSRMVAALILECFVMISSDGIEIANSDREYAAKDAVIWRKRMIREGGFGKTDVVDARGLLLLISGFGIQDHVFKIQDIMDLIRASNWKGISAALRRSAFLMPKIPDVISLMVKNNLEIEAVDMAYTFGLEDMCNPQNILMTYLNNKIKDIQNDSRFQKLEALKSVKQCLESHNVDPWKLLPDFKINEEIQNLEKEVSESKLIQKRKSLENSIHQEAKRACFGHENIEESIVSNKPEEIDNLMKPEQTEETLVLKKPEELDTLINSEEIDTSKKPEETALETSCGQTTTVVPEAIVSEPNQSHEHVRTPENHEEIDVLKNPEVINVSKKLEQTDILNKPEEIDILEKPEQTDICQKPEELGTSMIPEEIDAWKKPEEPVPETSCDQTTHAVSEAIVSEQNPNSLEQIDVSKKHAVTDISKKPEQTVILNKPEEIDILKKHEPDDICKNPEETAVIKKHGELDTSMIPEETDSLKNREEIDASKKLEEVDTSMIPEEVDTSKRPEETVPEISCDQTTPAVPEAIVSEQNKSVVCVLQSLCQSMSAKKLKRHVVAHFSEMINLREEIAKTLKLAKDPAKLVLCSIGRFFVNKSFRWTKENVGRMAAVLILECFVMISSDGIKIAKEELERAAAFAVEWRNRMIKEGGVGKTDEVDARGLLLLISGFGIQDHVFKVPDIMDLIRASNWKGISTALCRSAFLIPQIPHVISLMVKNNLEIEAVDIAYTFGLEDTCNSQNILTTYLHDKIKDIQNDSPFQKLEAMKQQFIDLKSVKQCLESHYIDPSTLLPDFKINEKIQNLEKKHVETFGDQSITAVPEAVVLEQKPNRTATSDERSNEINVRAPEGLEETYIGKDPQGIDVLQKREENYSSRSPEETYTSKKQRKRRKTGNHKKDKDKDKDKETALNKFAGKLQFLCKNMVTKGMRWHVAKHLSETLNLHEEIIKALKLAKDPAKLVLNCTGNFFGQDSRSFCKDLGNKETAGRLASVLMLECFVMISNDDGIEIEKRERERALSNAVIWRKRMIREGGFGHTDEVDARGLLLLISGFGIQDDVFKIQDIVDLIRASNAKGISTALRRSAFLMPKIPEVISLMVKNNLEIEAVDMAYTFGLEDTCNSRNILTTYLHHKIKDIQNNSSFQKLEAMKQQLIDLKSVKQCLEFHSVNPSTLLPDFKINEKIQNLEKEVNESKLIQKRKSLENSIHQEAKRACFGHENMPHQHESATTPDSIDFLHNYEEIDTSKNLEEVDVSKNSEEIDVSENPVEIDTSNTLEEFDALKKHEEIDTLMKHAETNPLKKQEETVPEAIVSEQNPDGMAPNGEQSHEIVTETESVEEINVSNKPKPEELDTWLIPEETVLETSVVSVLRSFCESMCPRQLKRHIATHFSEMVYLREEIAKALKLANDPAELVISSIGKFFVSHTRSFHDDFQNLSRMAAVLILECFVMISSDDGIKIVKRDRECAAKDASIWKKRMIEDGGFTDEVDARGLLLFISGFGIQDHVFKPQDIMDLIRASNWKGISTALRRSVFLMPKIPEVISLMVKNNLEIEAVDMAYTFGLEDTCNSRNILTTYLHNKIKDIQNDSPFQKLEALKSVKQCLESHNVDPSTLLPDFKINEEIQNLEKEVSESKLIQKRKSLDNSIHQEAKRACFGHESKAAKEFDVSKNPEEQNPNGVASNGEQSHGNVTTSETLEESNISNEPEEIDNLMKPEQTEETVVLKKPEELGTSMIPEEIDTSKNREETDIWKKPEETVPETSCAVPEAIVSEQNPNRTETEASKKSVISVLQLQAFCQSMNSRQLKQHVAAHISEMINLREEIVKALKLAEDPAKLVLGCVIRLGSRVSRSFPVRRSFPVSRTVVHDNNQKLSRMATVLILECFVMISSDGIEIAKSDQECAANAAVDWKIRMLKEGGFGKTDEIDARGLLLFISGFGIQDHVFNPPDIMDLMRASNWKGISTALCRSAFLIPKMPWVIFLMLKNNLEVEAVDIAYTFGLEDMCHPKNILTEYLNNKIKDFQNSPPFQTKEAVEQHLSDLKLVKKCLESHNVDPSMLLPDHKINKNIQNLEKEVKKWKLIQPLENPLQQENMSKNPEEIHTCEEIDPSKKHSETDTSEKPEETVPETSYDETITTVPEAIVSEQNPNRTNSNLKRSDKNVRTPESLDETDICKNTEVTVILKNPEEESDTPMIPEETDTSKKPEETVPETSSDQTEPAVPKAIVTEQNPNRIETEASKKSAISELESLCESMSSKELKWHVAANLSEMINFRKELAKALKLAKDPANLVINSIGAFFVQDRRTFLQKKQDLGRKAAVLILEWFVMISGDVIEIAKSDVEYAAQAAVNWRKRMMREGGPRQADEVDARGLLLLVSGFGIQDHVFEIRDIVDLIRASNVKEISVALRRSVFLVPKIPEVIDLMVKNNLEIEAADIAYTFGLEDKCHPLSILATFLRSRIKNIHNGSFFHMLEETKQQLLDLKSVKQCLESHNIDPSTHLPDFKINEKIQNLEKELNEEKPIQKRKSLDGPIHQEAKRACFGHESMPPHQSPVDHYGMNRYHQSTQLSTGYRDLHNSCINNYSPSSVYNTAAMRETITSPVPNGPAGGFTGSYNHMHHSANVQPYGWHEPSVQHYPRQVQTYDSQPYGRDRPQGWVPPEPLPPSNPSRGFPRRRGPSSDLYSFADKVEKGCMR